MFILPQEKVIEILNGLIENVLKPKFIELGMNASGQWLSSLEARYTGINKGEIWGMDYTQYLANGRSGGTMPPVEPLIRWVGNKFGYSGREAVSMAWAVAKKIEREGTNYYPNGTDLLSVLNSPEALKYVEERFANYIVSEVKTQFINITKKALK